MIKALKKKYALSDQGAKDLLKGIVYSVLANISLMFPVILLAIVLNQLLAPVLGASAPEISAAVYTVIGIVILAVVFIFHYCQYTATYLGTYDESARRRIGLAEKLRTLPLTFFHQRDLADLTSTIMGDCANFEHAFSHTVPQFFGAVISTGIVCIGLLIFNWQMGLALLWVAPISFAIVILSRKWQEKLSKKHMNARLELAEGIQECLETVQDIKACNQEEDYLRKLDAKMDAAEKAQISSEMTTASLLTTGQMFLRLGLATVIVVGNSLVVSGDTSLFTYILFLIAASRLYDPLSGAMSNMAELFSVQLQVNRLKEIEEYPEETGEKNIHTNGYDITFDHVQFSYEKGKPVLRDVSFTAKQGQVTALVGPSGGGKSTVAKLAAKFYPLDGGRILLGGTDIAPLNSTMLMKNFSIVFQDVVLFNNTIMENIRVGKKDATDEEVIAAAKAAQCDEFISKLSDGYQTVIGENGSTLSGGEAQRLSIARALLKMGYSVDTGRNVYLQPSLASQGVKGTVTNALASAFVGSLGGGKSFCNNLLVYYSVLFGGQAVILDPKAERGNWKETLPEIAHEINIVNLTSDKDNAGLLDPFVIMKNVKDAESLAIDILTFLTGISSRDGEKFPVLRKAVRSVTQSDSRGLLHVIDELRREDTPISRNIADHIDSFTDYDFAHLLFSDGTVENAISLDNQLNIIQVDDLVLPDKDTTFEEYTTIELLSVSMLIVISTFALDFIHSDRSIFKIVDLDEAWAFLNVAQGETLSNKLVRAGRAMQAGVYFVTQSSGDVSKESLKNNIGLKFAFRSTDLGEIKQTLEFFGIDKDDENNQKRLRDLENGQCLLQDLYGRVGVVQIHPVFEELLHAFDTRPPVQRNEVE